MIPSMASSYPNVQYGIAPLPKSPTGQSANLVYTNAWSKLDIGRCRYGLMCHEDGMVFDDGVTTRLGENHYLMSTTTGNSAERVTRHPTTPPGRMFANALIETSQAAAGTSRVAMPRMTSSEMASPDTSPTIRPSRMTRARSAMPTISGNSELIIRMATPDRQSCCPIERG